MFWPSDLTGVDGKVALRLIAVARSIAPCLDTLAGDAKEQAAAILEGVAAELPQAGSRRARSQSRNGTSVTWDAYGSAFTDDDRDALRALCGVSGLASAGSPAGSFPPSTITTRIWPSGLP